MTGGTTLDQLVHSHNPGRGAQIHNRALTVLNAIAATPSQTLDVNQVLRQALTLALEAADVEAGVIAVLDQTTNELVFHVHQGGHVHDFAAKGIRVPVDQGIWGLAMTTGRPVVTENVSRDVRILAPEFYDEGIQAMVLTPMHTRGRVLGMLGLMSYEPREFAPEELAIISAVANQIGTTLDHARLFATERRRSSQASLVDQVLREATATLNLDEILETAAVAIQRRFAYPNVAILLVDRATQELFVGSSTGYWSLVADHYPNYRQAVGKSVVGRVAETGQTLLTNDVTLIRSPDPSALADSDGHNPAPKPIGSELAIPMRTVSEDTVIGVLDIQVPEREAFDQEDVRAMETLANKLAVAIENARLHRGTEHQLAEVSALYHLAQRINASVNVQEVLDAIVWSLKETMACRGCSIALIDPVGDVLEIHTAAGVERRWQDDFQLRLGEGVAGRVALEGRSIYVPDVLEWDGYIVFDPSVRSLLTVPLSIQQRVIGTLTVDSDEPAAFSEADEKLLTIAATQAAIAIENARLYVSLEQRAQNLADAYAELKKADRLRNEMMQNVSHELRTPLTFVKGYVELLLDEDESMGALSADHREYLQIVSEKTDVITRLVNDILSLQQAEQVPLQKAPVSLTKLAQRAVRGCTATAEKTGLTVVENLPNDLPPVAADEDRLLQVFDNLLGNAIKFSLKGGQILVSVEEMGPMVQASITDYGIGIPKDQHERIFERFYQVDGSAQRRYGGAGLGLAIVKRIVEDHGGQVWVESEPGRGSTFHFTVPKHQNLEI